MVDQCTKFRHKVGADKNPPWMLTFRDVIIAPKRTDYNVKQQELDMSMCIGPYKFHYPFITAAMDTVTEEEMAVKAAQLGALGVIHRNQPLDEQLTLVKKVKRSRSYMVENVTKVHPDNPIDYARNIMGSKGISGLVVVDEDNKFQGILTKRDLKIPSCLKSKINTVSDAMTTKSEAVYAYEGISVEDAEKKMYLEGRVEKLPIVKENGELVGLMTQKDLQTEYPNASIDDKGRLICALGVSPFKPESSAGLNTLKEIDQYADIFFTDVADFHKNVDIKSARELMEELDTFWVLGNIGTYEAMEDLVSAGFPEDKFVGVKVGMGSGSICSTTINTGFGAPTLYATASVADALVDYGLKDKMALIADGGLKDYGDPAKAFTAGATGIMSGHFFAGCTEAPGYVDTIEGRKVKVYRGMGSKEARSTGLISDRYDNDGDRRSIPEGVSGYVPYVGDLSVVINDLNSSLKKGMNYGGAVKIEDFYECVFGRSTPTGQGQAAPHDLLGK